MTLKNSINKQNENQSLNGLFAALLFFLTIAASFWVGWDMENGGIQIYHVIIAASITAFTTGFGAFPFLLISHIENRWVGIGNSLAAGLMFGASVGLVFEGATMEGSGNAIIKVCIGLVLGVVLVSIAHKFLDSTDKDYSIGDIQGANALKMLMIVGIMTIHSFAEGVGVGVSYGDSPQFGSFIALAIAIHNIPEGLAISLVLIPRGTSIRNAGLWSIFSSLPQPLMAVPAFLFVLTFKTFLPIGLGFAAGAMFWMVLNELLPDARKELSTKKVYSLTAITALLMILFQILIEI